MKKFLCGLICCLLLLPALAQAGPQQVWDEAMGQAKLGHDEQAITLLKGASLISAEQNLWIQRFDIASRMLALRENAKHDSIYNVLLLSGNNQHEMMLGSWLNQHPLPQTAGSSVPGILASMIPGAGHAWMGRWGDAGVSAMLVWPLLILTFWAARRDMGPVTVFFALMTAWLWSGTVFSAVSLAERGDYELYYSWWREMWVASGLPARPW